jgi:hypothetical protein
VLVGGGGDELKPTLTISNAVWMSPTMTPSANF